MNISDRSISNTASAGAHPEFSSRTSFSGDINTKQASIDCEQNTATPAASGSTAAGAVVAFGLSSDTRAPVTTSPSTAAAVSSAAAGAITTVCAANSSPPFSSASGAARDATAPAAIATACNAESGAAPTSRPANREVDSCSSLLDFLLVVGQLKTLKRTGWLRSGIQQHRAESVAEHSFRAAVCAMVIGSEKQSAELIANGKLDRSKCVRMALVHDLAEALVGDITPYCQVTHAEKQRREREALKQICALLPVVGCFVCGIEERASSSSSSSSACVCPTSSSLESPSSSSNSTTGSSSSSATSSSSSSTTSSSSSSTTSSSSSSTTSSSNSMKTSMQASASLSCSRSINVERLASSSNAELVTSQPTADSKISTCSSERVPIDTGKTAGEVCGRDSEEDINRAQRSDSSHTPLTSREGPALPLSSQRSNKKSTEGDGNGNTTSPNSCYCRLMQGETAEAQFVFDVDKFEMLLQAYEYEVEWYKDPTLVVNGSRKQLRAQEHPAPHPTETAAATQGGDPKRMCLARKFTSCQQESSFSMHADAQQQQQPQALLEQPHHAAEQQQQVLQDDRPVLGALQCHQQSGRTAHQQKQFPVLGNKRTNNQQEQRQQEEQERQLATAEEPPPESVQQQQPAQPPLQHSAVDATKETKDGLDLSSFFVRTEGVFRSALFQKLDTLLRERRRRLHCMHASSVSYPD